MQNRSAGRVHVLRAVVKALGATLALKEANPTSFFNGVGVSSRRMDWRTPRWLLERLYGIYEFDLDAASDSPPSVRAKVHYGAGDDELFRPWHGVTWINPPYGRGIGAWVAKCRREVASGRAQTVVALLPARVGARWWRENVVGSAAVVFLPGRLRFDDGKNSAPFDVAIVLWGASEDQIGRVVAAFEGSWLASLGGEKRISVPGLVTQGVMNVDRLRAGFCNSPEP